MASVTPKESKQAERLGYQLATPEEIEARESYDAQGFSERRGRNDPDSIFQIADCTKPGSEGTRCHVSNCIDDFIFVYVCEAGVCKLARR